MPVPLSRAARGRVAAVLPDPFPGLARSRYQVRFRRAQLVMLAGPPGGGKTTWALIAAIKMAIPTLYISADSDETTMAARTAAAVTGHPVSIVEETIRYGLFAEEYGPRLAELPIRFVFDPSEPSIEDIAHALTAWMEVWGDTPHLIIVDNLLNCKTGGEEWTGMRQMCKDLHWLARKSKACVLLLHHTSEQDSSHIESAPPRSAIQGKVSQLPSLILTLTNNAGGLFVAVVKNRHGQADPMARLPVRMVADLTCCQIWDTTLTGGVSYGGAKGWNT